MGMSTDGRIHGSSIRKMTSGFNKKIHAVSGSSVASDLAMGEPIR